MLLSRRLIEAGVRIASITWAPDANATWIHPRRQVPPLDDALLPQLDAAPVESAR